MITFTLLVLVLQTLANVNVVPHFFHPIVIAATLATMDFLIAVHVTVMKMVHMGTFVKLVEVNVLVSLIMKALTVTNAKKAFLAFPIANRASVMKSALKMSYVTSKQVNVNVELIMEVEIVGNVL